MYPENLKETRVILGSMNMGYDVSESVLGLELATKCTPILLGHSDIR